jgi:RNA polymerase sigma-54 factor
MSMRMEQRQLLTPRMIQSMEILQLPLMALEERIEQELQNNPVLELKDAEPDEHPAAEEDSPDSSGNIEDRSEGEQTLVLREDHQTEDFERLARIGEYLENEEFATNGSFRPRRDDGERDKKLDAMNNAAARGITLEEHLLAQWALVEAPPEVQRAGRLIIGYIDEEGYLRTPLEQILTESQNGKAAPSLGAMRQALSLIHELEPAGVGARDLPECLLLQLEAIEQDEELSKGHDFPLERALLRDHLKDLEMNRYPVICKRLGIEVEQVKAAVHRLSRLHPHPGKLIGSDQAPGINPDAIVYYDEETDKYEIEMSRDAVPDLSISGRWRKFLKERQGDKKTREFLANHVRNARWLIESIEQRRSTIQRVIRVVVDAQRDFFDKGPEFLRPLPMIQVAEQLGIHVATVSRAVSEKWIQTPRGVFPLRRFFSGGTTSAEGEDMSWDAVKEKLKVIINEEDKQNPLNDDEIVDKLKSLGIDLARRTVAKYRKILNISTARQRKAY